MLNPKRIQIDIDLLQVNYQSLLEKLMNNYGLTSIIFTQTAEDEGNARGTIESSKYDELIEAQDDIKGIIALHTVSNDDE